jgi:hypothetical protein
LTNTSPDSLCRIRRTLVDSPSPAGDVAFTLPASDSTAVRSAGAAPAAKQWVPAAKLRRGGPLKTPDGAKAKAYAEGGTVPVSHVAERELP